MRVLRVFTNIFCVFLSPGWRQLQRLQQMVAREPNSRRYNGKQALNHLGVWGIWARWWPWYERSLVRQNRKLIIRFSFGVVSHPEHLPPLDSRAASEDLDPKPPSVEGHLRRRTTSGQRSGGCLCYRTISGGHWFRSFRAPASRNREINERGQLCLSSYRGRRGPESVVLRYLRRSMSVKLGTLITKLRAAGKV